MIKEDKAERKIYKQAQVRSLFDSIAGKYDFLNHTLSFGIDILWRKKLVKLLQDAHPQRILDAAVGTADLAIETARIKPTQIIGIDISQKMLDIAWSKIQNKNLTGTISLEIGEAERLRFDSCTFDAVISAFGVRNFENLKLGLCEFYRVLCKGGIVMILEFSKPKKMPVKQLYKLYSKFILPWMGGMISKNRPAYDYLPDTIREFPDGEDFCRILSDTGFSNVNCYPQTFGIASIYTAVKEF
ncbi:MAG: bifunctional demethylmenaquinone methyltransferase/2-methoxy-6-polyprenyl-1,4-benzoquinol methylase UbiE [Bacteroidetes bacterium]|nr:bifunctional demethylmenaquinone methyltransferase/2-methoxy-6-polyprenyl-1,4-benzoquinol methylase UbiE [Bacteroidota bacterium]